MIEEFHVDGGATMYRLYDVGHSIALDHAAQPFCVRSSSVSRRRENALRVINDVYLARVYAAALEPFRERAGQRRIERKLAMLRETYAVPNSEAQSARAELLEIWIIVPWMS